MTATEQRPTVADVTRAVLSFVEAHGLDLPRLEVYANSPTAKGWDPQYTGGKPYPDPVPLPPGDAGIHFVTSGPAFLAWCRALGAGRVHVDRARAEYTRAWVNVWRDGIRWNVTGLLPHEHGTPHLPGAGVVWNDVRNTDRRYGIVTVDGLASIYAAEVAP